MKYLHCKVLISPKLQDSLWPFFSGLWEAGHVGVWTCLDSLDCVGAVLGDGQVLSLVQM